MYFNEYTNLIKGLRSRAAAPIRRRFGYDALEWGKGYQTFTSSLETAAVSKFIDNVNKFK